MTKEYYKVVSILGEELYSALYSQVTSESEGIFLKYIPGEWIRPKVEGSKIMVFENLDDAYKFASDEYWETRVYKCEVLNPSYDGPFVILVGSRSFPQMLDETIKGKRNSDKPLFENTVFCDAIKLIREVGKNGLSI